MSPPAATPYLFSIDLEDVRDMVHQGRLYREAVPRCTELYLRFLNDVGGKCTFFVVGNILRAYPDLVRRIMDEGHEIACHTDSHKPLDQLDRQEFRADLDRWMSQAAAIGVGSVLGFRAPILSMTEKTAWAYEVMAEFGFQYSSSVLPAANPLYGWKDFGELPRLMGDIVEIPLNLSRLGPLSVPFGGGVYFRVLPWFILSYFFSRDRKNNRPVLGYFHPYDVDVDQERFAHPGIGDSRLLNALMYVGRAGVEQKLRKVAASGFQVMRYDEYVQGVAPRY